MAFEPHVPEIAGVIQLAVAPVFMLSILFAVVSGLFICLLIVGAFLGAFVRADLSYTIGAMFIFAMLALIACLLLFLREIFLAVSTPRHVPR